MHGAVVNNDEETFHKRTADPVPNQIFASKDQNGLNPLHKVTIKEISMQFSLQTSNITMTVLSLPDLHDQNSYFFVFVFVLENYEPPWE